MPPSDNRRDRVSRGLGVFPDLMRLRSGPQDVPANTGLLFVLASLYVLQGFLTGELIEEPDAAPRTFLAIAVQFAVITILLRLKNFGERVQQTLVAMAGTGLIFGLISIPLLLQFQPNTSQPGLALAYLGLFAWSLAVDGHIYRHALSIKMSMGVLAAVLIFAVNFILLKSLFG